MAEAHHVRLGDVVDSAVGTGAEGSGGAASTAPRVPALVLGAAMLLGACSSSTVVDRSGPMLADTLTGSQQVASVVVRPSSILVTYQEATGTRTR